MVVNIKYFLRLNIYLDIYLVIIAESLSIVFCDKITYLFRARSGTESKSIEEFEFHREHWDAPSDQLQHRRSISIVTLMAPTVGIDE